MADKKVILYSQPTCPPCHTAKNWLTNEGIPFEVRDIRENPDYIDELVKLGSSATPTFVIGDDVYMGFDQNKIKAAWDTYSA